MKDFFFTISLLAVSPFLFSAVAQEPGSPIPLISVSGEAEIRIAPDIVVITLGVESRATSLDDAIAENSKRITGLIEYIKSQDIEDKHIQTDYIDIRPSYDHRESHTSPSHYQVNKSVTIRVTKIESFETLLAGALKNGASNVHGIQFQTSELRKHRDAARANAIKAAREKAIALTGELGKSIGDVHMISETTWGGFGSYDLRGGMMTQNTIQNISGGSAGAEFAAGQIAISARVSASFLIK